MQRKKSPTVVYQGRVVPLDHFRVYVYGKEGKLLVNNYADYQNALKSGEWFSTMDEANKGKDEIAPVMDATKVGKDKKVKPNDANSERIRQE